jgi:hypothetical protein
VKPWLKCLLVTPPSGSARFVSTARGENEARQAIEEAAARVLAAGLLQDGSAFTPERAIWTAAAASELFEAFVDAPEVGSGDFLSKLRRQTEHCAPRLCNSSLSCST